MWFLGLLAGALVGAIAGESGALAGGFIGAVAGLAWSLSRGKATAARIAELEAALGGISERLRMLEEHAARQPAAGSGATAGGESTATEASPGVGVGAMPAASAASAAAPFIPAREVIPDRSDEPVFDRSDKPVAEPEPLTEGAPAVAEAPLTPSPPSAPARLWQWLTGGNPFVRVGAVVLFFGVAFLLRYAAEHVRFPIELRLAAVAAGAIGLLALGWRLRLRHGAYGLILQGAAIGVLYLTVFAAYRLYGLLPGAFALFLLVALAAFSAVLAIAQDSRALAVAGASGGFLAPVLASTGSGSHVALFSYYLVLNAGILAIAWFKAWRLLNVVGFGFTFVIGTLWGARYYRPELFASTEPFLVAFFLFYVAIALLFARRQAGARRNAVDGTLVFGTPLVVFLLQARLVEGFELGAAYSAVALSAFYLLAAFMLRARAAAGLQLLAESFLALGMVFATLAIPLAFDARVTAASWALEGAAIVWVSARQQRRLGQAAGSLLQIAAGFAFMLAEEGGEASQVPILNSGYLGACMVALGGLYCARTLSALAGENRDWRYAAAWALLLWGVLWWCGAGVLEIDRFVAAGVADHAISLHLVLTCFAFSLLHRALRWNEARFVAYCWLPILYLSALADWNEMRHPFQHLGYVAWPLAFALHFVLLHRHEHEAMPTRLYHAAGLWLLCALASWELGWAIGEVARGGSVWRAIGWAIVPGALLWTLATASERIAWPIARNREAYLLWGAAPIALVVFAWTIGVNFASSGDPAPLPYVPLLNPLDLAQIAAFLGVIAWVAAVRRSGFGSRLEPYRHAAAVLGAGAAFVWLTAVLLRTLHHWAGVPFGMTAMMESMLVQASLSIFWTLLALGVMIFATRQAQRMVWMAGAGLMAVVTAKLFFVDLSHVGGIERIVSFLGVGVLLLAVGYFSPVPPKQAR